MSKNLIIFLLLSIIAIFVVINVLTELPSITDKRNTMIDSLTNQINLRDTLIIEKQEKIKNLKQQNTDLNFKIDSLKNLKKQIITEYEKIYITIDHATNYQLDSIIRANW